MGCQKEERMMDTVNKVAKWGAGALGLAGLLMGLACSGQAPREVATHPCQWEETCVVLGAEVSPRCDARWVCPALGTGRLAASLHGMRP